MKNQKDHNSLFKFVFLVLLSMSLSVPVQWFKAPEMLFYQVIDPRSNQGKLKDQYILPKTVQQLDQGFLETTGIEKIKESMKYEKELRIDRLNPSSGDELYTLKNHTKPVQTVTFSPDGLLLASGGEDKKIIIWDVTSGTVVRKLEGHNHTVSMVRFSPDGMILASCSFDNTVKIWNLTSGKTLQTLTSGFLTWVQSITFSPDGGLLVSGDSVGNMKIWNTTNWQEEPRIINAHGAFLSYVDFSPDGTLLVSCGDVKEGTMKIWNTSNWDEIPPNFTGHTDIVKEVKFSPNGNMLASACADSTYWIWDVNSGNISYKYNHTEITPTNIIWEVFSSVDYSPTGSVVASGGEDTLIRLWDPARNPPTVQILSGHENYINEIVFSPDGTLLASCSMDNTIKLWNVARGAELETLHNHKSAVTSVDFSHDGILLVSGSKDNTIKLWNMTSETDSLPLSIHEDIVTSVVFSPDSSLLASSSWDSNIILWNVTSNKLKFKLTNHTGLVHSIDFSPGDPMLASGSGTTTLTEVRIWNVTNGKQLGNPLSGHNSPVTSVAFSHDGKVLASGSEDGGIIIRNVTNWTELKTLSNWHDGVVKSIAFSPIDTLLVSCGEDNIIKLLNVTSGEELPDLTGHTSSVLSVNFSPDGKLLASGSADGTIRLWNMSDGNEVQIYCLSNVQVNSVTFSPDGKIIASGSSDAKIKLWDSSAIPDFDTDGMPDRWELDFSPELDSSDYWDKFHDDDDDGLMNSLEYFLMINPLKMDSDGDLMPDGWEYLGGLDPRVDDASNDSDDDGMSNLYEYQMGLNPRVNDAALDKDNDNLTNYQEFQLGLNATNKDTDYDGMLDGWEVDYDLDPVVNDANGDPDGDWVNNINEYRANTNPQDFWSVPLFAFSAYLLIRVMILLIIAAIGVVMFLNYRNNQRKAFITSVLAPDYATALKVQKSGYTDYTAFVQAVSDAETLVGKGMDSYYQSDPVKAIQQLERSLTLFERTENDTLVARTIFQAARIQKERQELAADSSILKLFPKPPFTDLAIEAIDHMLQALLAENERNWGLANNEWQAALSREELDIDLRITCQGALLESEVRTWLENPIDASRETLLSHLDEWQEACQINQQFPSLCQAYLLRARVSFASFLFEEVEKWLEQCSETAEINKLLIYQEAVRKEKVILLSHKKRIEEEMAKSISPEEQAQIMQEYIKEALESLRKERLI